MGAPTVIYMSISFIISFFGAFIIFVNKGFRKQPAICVIGGIFLSQGCYMFWVVVQRLICHWRLFVLLDKTFSNIWYMSQN